MFIEEVNVLLAVGSLPSALDWSLSRRSFRRRDFVDQLTEVSVFTTIFFALLPTGKLSISRASPCIYLKFLKNVYSYHIYILDYKVMLWVKKSLGCVFCGYIRFKSEKVVFRMIFAEIWCQGIF